MNLMKTKTKKGALFAVCILALLCLLFGSILIAGADDVPVWGGDDVQTEYVSHRKLTLPIKTVTVGEKTETAAAVVRFPDGTAKKVDTLFLDQTGEYTVSYTAKIDGKVYGKTDSFAVVSANVRTGENSSAVWARSEQYDDTGLQVSLAQGEILEFSNTIDITQYTSETNVDGREPLIEMYATPAVVGKEDFRRWYITFTDSVNPNETFTVLVRNWESDTYSVVSAAAYGQEYTSWQWYDQKVFRGEEGWQTPMGHSFTAQYAHNAAQKNRPYKMWYEDDTKRIYYDTLDLAPAQEWKVMMSDLDDPTYYNRLFEGFSSGRIRLSIRADEYMSTKPATFTVKRVADIDLTRAVADFGDAPTITVDGVFDVENAPNAKIGGTYPVPAANAADGEGQPCAVSVNAYYVNGSVRLPIPVENGRFATDKEGRYSIEYVAVDASGVQTVKKIAVQAVAEVAAPELTVVKGDTEGTVGKPVMLGVASTVSANASVSVTVVKGDETIAVRDNRFVPERTGTYTVTYTVTDVCGQSESESYSVAVSAADAPVCLTEPQFPKYLIAGGRYVLPELKAYAIDVANATEVDTTVYVTDMRNTFVVPRGNVYIPAVENNGDRVTVTYKVGDATVYERAIPCVQAFRNERGRKILLMENFFVSDAFAYDKYDTYMTCTATQANASWEFARALPAESFSLTLGMIPEYADFASVKVTLSDSTDENNAVSYYIDRTPVDYGGNMVRNIGFIRVANGKNVTRLQSDTLFASDTGATRTVIGAYANGSWLFNGNYSVRIVNRDDGKPFSGFEGDVYCKVTLADGKVGARISVSNICGQTISANPLDSTAPTVVIEGDRGGRMPIGGTATVRKATAFDVLDPMTALSVSVTAPDGSAVTATDGTLLSDVPCDREYEFTVNVYGSYAVLYRACDAFGGNVRQIGYNVLVRDDVAPIITLKSAPQTNGKIGTAFVIPDIEVTDNVTAREGITLHKTVIAPNTAATLLGGSSNAYVPKYTGVYTVMITAFDEQGNASIVTYDVTVTG